MSDFIPLLPESVIADGAKGTRGPLPNQPSLFLRTRGSSTKKRKASHKKAPRGPKGVWYIRDGKEEISTRCTDWNQARIQLAIYIQKRLDEFHGRTDPKQISFGTVLLDELKFRKPAKAAPAEVHASYSTFAAHCRALLTFFGTKTFGDVERTTINEESIFTGYVNFRTEQQVGYQGPKIDPSKRKTVSYTSAQGELWDLKRAVTSYCQRHGLGTMPHIVVPPGTVTRERFLYPWEVLDIIRAIRGWQRADDGTWLMKDVWVPSKQCYEKRPVLVDFHERRLRRVLFRFLVLGVLTGSRHEVMLKLVWQRHVKRGSIDLSEGMIHRKGLGEKETRKLRPSSPLCRKMLVWADRWHRADAKRGVNAVIHKVNGASYSTHINWLWKRVVQEGAKLDDDVIPHTLRHTAITYYYQLKMPVERTARYLGLSTQMLRDTYLHWPEENERLSVDPLNDREQVRKLLHGPRLAVDDLSAVKPLPKPNRAPIPAQRRQSP